MRAYPVVTLALAAQVISTSPLAEPRQVFRGETTLIPVDVRVVDRYGKPVIDLTREEFSITEDDVPQHIRQFATRLLSPTAPVLVSAPATAGGLSLRSASPDSIEPQNRRVFLLVLGEGRLQPPAKGVDGAIHLVRDRLMPQDLVAVIAWNRATEFTTEHAKVTALLERIKKVQESIENRLAYDRRPPPGPGGNTREADALAALMYASRGTPEYLQAEIDALFEAGGLSVKSTQPTAGRSAARLADDRRRAIGDLTDAARTDPTGGAALTLADFVETDARTMQDVGKINGGIEYLRHFDGEKHLIFLTERGLVLPRSEDDRDLGSAAADARVVMHFIQTGGMKGAFEINSSYSASHRGLASSPAGVASGTGTWEAMSGRATTNLTGGNYFTGQYASQAMDTIDGVSRQFTYVLGYSPTNTTLDSKYRRIRVTVSRPGVRVFYRSGYYAAPEMTPLDREHMVAYGRVVAAASYPQPVTDIGVRATATASKAPAAADVRIELSIDPSRLNFAQTTGRNADELELLVGVLDARDNLLAQVWKRVQLSFSDERLDEVKRTGVPVSLTLPVTGPASAVKRVKVVVYDYAADLLGSAIVNVR